LSIASFEIMRCLQRVALAGLFGESEKPPHALMIHVPTPPRAALTRPIAELIDEYLRWGAFQGGLHGRGWSAIHQHNLTRHLHWWCTTLHLETLADCRDILPAVERGLQGLKQAGRSGKTLVSYRDSLRALCVWCVERCYLDTNPLKG